MRVSITADTAYSRSMPSGGGDVSYLKMIRSSHHAARCAPHVSVVIPAYEAEAFIAATLDSASQQSFSDLEIIVVDDASPDHTAAVVETAARPDDRIQVNRR